jgi:hypothetical protein
MVTQIEFPKRNIPMEKTTTILKERVLNIQFDFESDASEDEKNEKLSQQSFGDSIMESAIQVSSLRKASSNTELVERLIPEQSD